MWSPLELPLTMLHERTNVLLIGFSEIGEDVDSLACGGHFNSITWSNDWNHYQQVRQIWKTQKTS